jgi:hypothetical protein
MVVKNGAGKSSSAGVFDWPLREMKYGTRRSPGNTVFCPNALGTVAKESRVATISFITSVLQRVFTSALNWTGFREVSYLEILLGFVDMFPILYENDK